MRVLECVLFVALLGAASTSASTPTCEIWRRPFAAFSSTGSGSNTIPSDTVSKAKSSVLSLAQQLNEESKTGVFIIDPSRKADLKRAVADLEAVCGPPTDRARQLMLGDWTLLCTTNTPTRTAGDEGGSKSKKQKLPFTLPKPPYNPLQDKVQKSFDVTQRIRADEEDSTTISRVDNVVEFTPFADTLGDLLGEDSPVGGALKQFNLNPLEVSKSKVSLIHDAKVESISPALRTKISLKSIVLNIAGKSQYLEPEGKDIIGLNVPLGELLNSGSFDTTYVDESIRISRGTIGFLDELRVFVRKGLDVERDESAYIEEILSFEEETKSELQSRVEDVVDAVGNAIEDVREVVEKDAEMVREAVEDSVKEVQEVVEKDVEEVQKAVEGVVQAVSGETKAAEKTDGEPGEEGEKGEDENKDGTESDNQ